MGDKIENDNGAEIEAGSTESAEQIFEESNPLEEMFSDAPPSEMGKEKEVTELPAAEVAKEVETAVVPEVEKKVEVAAIPTVEDLQKEIVAFKAKALDETSKRQALEQSIAAQNKKPVEAAEFDWDNPQKSVDAAVNVVRQEAQTDRLDMSEAHAKSRHEDYDEKYEVFVAMATENPAILQQMLSQVDPAEYAYNLAAQRIFSDEVGKDPETYEAKLKAKHFLEFETAAKTKTDGRQEIVNNLPPSAKNMTDKNTPVETVDNDPLGELFPGEVAS